MTSTTEQMRPNGKGGSAYAVIQEQVPHANTGRGQICGRDRTARGLVSAQCI